MTPAKCHRWLLKSWMFWPNRSPLGTWKSPVPYNMVSLMYHYFSWARKLLSIHVKSSTPRDSLLLPASPAKSFYRFSHQMSWSRRKSFFSPPLLLVCQEEQNFKLDFLSLIWITCDGNNNTCSNLKQTPLLGFGKLSIFIAPCFTPIGHYHWVKRSQRVQWSWKRETFPLFLKHDVINFRLLFSPTMPPEVAGMGRAWKLFQLLFFVFNLFFSAFEKMSFSCLLLLVSSRRRMKMKGKKRKMNGMRQGKL